MRNIIFITTVIFLLVSINAYADKTITIYDECVYLDELTAPHIGHIKVVCGIGYGETKYFSKEAIQNHLSRAGIKATVLAGVTVVRDGEKISESDITSSIEKVYSKAYPNLKISIEQTRFPKELYTQKEGDFKVNVDTGKFGANYAEVNNGKKRMQVYFYVRAFKDSFISTERIKAGEVVETKARKELIDITNMKSLPLDDIEGIIAAKPIGQGRPITIDVTEAQPALKKGESVKLVYNNGAINIETLGIIEDNAYVGKPVQVRNTLSQKTITANYVGDGIAMALF